MRRIVAKEKGIINKVLYKYTYNFSVKKKLIISFILIILFPNLFIGISASYITRSYLEKAEMRNNSDSISTLNSIVDFNYETYIKKSETIFNNVTLQSQLVRLKDVKNIEEFMSINNFVSDFLVSITNEFNYSSLKYTQSKYLFENATITIFAINYSFSSYGEHIKPFDLIKDYPWCKNVVQNNQMQWNIIHDSNSKTMVRFSRKLVNFKNQSFIGVLCIDIPVSRIYGIISDNYKYSDSDIFYTDNDGNMLVKKGNSPEEFLVAVKDSVDIYKNNQDAKSLHIGSGNYIVSYSTSSITGWKLVSVIPSKYIIESSRKIELIMLCTVILSIFFCILVSVFNANILISRLRKLMHKIRKLEKDYYSEIECLNGNDEIGELDRSFNHMIEEIKRLIDTEYKSRIIRDSAKLQLLQEQINPHLLYNTLSTIGWKAKNSGDREIFDITNSLIRFYRTSLNRGNIIIKLQQEVDMTMEYMDIMEYTYNLNFIKDVNIDKRIYDFYSIKLILQPIVENALFHGIRNIRYKGYLKITGEYRGNVIVFNIRDNGMGMDKETVDNLMKCADDGSEKGYGVSSVISRLQLFFGKDYGVNIRSNPGAGTEVEVKIPAFTEEQLKKYLTDRYLL